MQDVKLYNTNGRDLTFKGEKLYSDTESTGTGTSLSIVIYKTSGGNYAVGKHKGTQWQGCSDNYTAAICKTKEDVIKFFGMSEQAKYLYQQCGFDCSLSEEEYLNNEDMPF
jgi:hypothetical protein